MPHIALATAQAALGLDPDLDPLTTALGDAGASTAIACWDDPIVDWANFDAVVLRSTWDYPERQREFWGWIDATARVSTILNPPEVIRWNADKTYLADLATDGVPVVETVFVAPGEQLVLPEAGEIVVKPSVSAGSRDTARYSRDDPEITRLAARIHDSGRVVMVQPYLTAVDTHGEHALVWFGGEYSHAFNKGAILRPGAPPTEALFAPERIEPATATDAQVAVADAALRSTVHRTGTEPVYARVDVVPGSNGEPVVLELELVEPSVYHWTGAGSAQRFAAAILDRI